jgi:hypothetical protein
MSVFMICALFWTKLRNPATAGLRMYVLGRVAFAMLGISVTMLGVYFYEYSPSLAVLIGAGLVVLGIQVTLWAVGITSETVGSLAKADAESESLQDDEPVTAELVRRLTDRVGMVAGSLENAFYENRETLQEARAWYAKLKYDSDERRGFFREIHRHTTSAIGILNYLKQSEHVEGAEDAQTAFKNEMSVVLRLLDNNQDVVYENFEVFKTFIEEGVALRFESAHGAVGNLEVLREFADRLQSRLGLGAS